jgi:hypothetical protein
MSLVFISGETLTPFQMRRRRRYALRLEGVGCVTLTESDAGKRDIFARLAEAADKHAQEMEELIDSGQLSKPS